MSYKDHNQISIKENSKMKTEWISVKDRLPECDAMEYLTGEGAHIIVYDGMTYYVSFICGDPYIWKALNPNAKFWMFLPPLPEPPQE